MTFLCWEGAARSPATRPCHYCQLCAHDIAAGQWDPYFHMMEELQERTDKASKAAAPKSTLKKPASGRKSGRKCAPAPISQATHTLYCAPKFSDHIMR